MKRGTLWGLIAVLVLVGLLSLPSSTWADGVPVTWTLSGVTFDDGGTASGSFVYNAATNTVSSINVETTAGTTFGGTTYVALDPGFDPLAFDIVLVPNASLADLTGTMYLDLEFPIPGLTNSGGIVGLLDIGSEGLCANAACDAPADSPMRMITGGEVVSPTVATPEPSAFLLLSVGLVCLVGVAKRKMLQA